MALAQGIPGKTIKRGLESMKQVRGRFEIVKTNHPATIVVDYAHTEDALRRLLQSCKDLNPQRVITVFGCGGDRDRSKRRFMGKTAVLNSDYVIVTSDNPRSEDPEKIMLDIEVGIREADKTNYTKLSDRRKAIEQAMKMSEKGDVVVIAGKGHEDYQILGDKTIHFDDKEEVKKIARKLKRKG